MRFAALIPLILFASTATAHPLPNLRYDRTVHVKVESTGVVVRYVLELNDWTMAIDGNRLLTAEDVAGLTGGQAYAKKYGAKKAIHIADNLRAKFDGRALNFAVKKIELEPDRDHPRFRFTFRAERTPSAGRFTFEDQNFEHVVGQISLTLEEANERVELLDIVEPTDLRGKASLEYKPGDDERARRVEATIRPPIIPEQPPAVPPSTVVSASEQPPPAPDVAVELSIERSLWADVRARGIAAIFDHDLGFAVLALLCVLFGAAHAFTPGHGKTMVAAYLVSERGTIPHAVVLGLSTTFAHTGSVIAVAILFRYVYGDSPPATTQTWLALCGGTVITLVGVWLLVRRLQGKVDHVHLGTANHHTHAETGLLGGPAFGCERPKSSPVVHDHSTHMRLPFATMNLSWSRVVLMGFGGGIVPCYDAILVFVMAANRGKIGLAVPLLVAFSLGLASVLVALGIVVVLTTRYGGRKLKERALFRYLPIVSAVLLTILGLWFLHDAAYALVTGTTLPVSAPVSLSP